MKTYAIYYMNQSFWSDGILGNFDQIEPKNLKKTHIYLKELTTEYDKDHVFDMMNHSHRPTREQVLNLNLMHSSMSVGDILVDKETNQVYVCATVGWKELK